MPIISRLDVMLVKRKRTLIEVSHWIEVSINQLSLIKNDKVRNLSVDVLSKLCTFLECQPGDLMENVSEEEYKKLCGPKFKNE